MSKTSLYGIYTVRFPFLDSAKFKVRPVVVVSGKYGKHGVVAVVPISAKLELEPVDFSIDEWRDAGLVKPSVARIHRLTTVLQSRLTVQLGTISASDTRKFKESLLTFLEL